MSEPSENPPADQHQIDGVKSRDPKASKAAGFPWVRAGFFVAVCGMVALSMGPLPGKVWRKLNSKDPQTTKTSDKAVTPDPKTLPNPTPRAPLQHTASSSGDVVRMSKGFTFNTKVTLEKGGAASEERKKNDAYVATYELKLRLPQPIKNLPDLEANSPKLGAFLPGLSEMLSSAEVSPFYFQLYENKTKRLQKNATKLNELMTKHNFYDCETILKLTHPRSKRRVLLVQAEMDVVSDGSDGDRLPSMPDKIVNSSYYQPMTSYGWKKTGTTVNPLIAGWESRIVKANAEIGQAATTPARRVWLKARIKKIEREIDDMKARSFLIADYDPFVVMPINMVTSRNDKHAAKIGDYCVVIHDGKLYPAIVGDAGPSFKMGEASLRLAKQINPRASSYSRPVSDLTVTYLVFPGSADPFQTPDYSRWRERCLSLLTDIGGLSENTQLHTWKNTLPIIPSDPE